MEKRAMAVREEQWLQTIAAAKQSGQPIKVWCAEHGVPVSSFYKWQRKMRDSRKRLTKQRTCQTAKIGR